MAAKMETNMEKTGLGLSDESYVSDQNHFNAINAHIKAYFENTPNDATQKDDAVFIGRFFLMLYNIHATDELTRTEALHSIKSMWENFTSIT